MGNKGVKIRKFNADRDYRAVRLAISSALQTAETLPWTEHVDVFYAFAQVLQGRLNAVVVEDTYVLVYNLGSPWYSPATFLEECLVLRVYDGDADFSAVTQALEGLAKHHGAKAIASATALAKSDRALSRMYQRAGFIPIGTRLYKAIKE